MSSISLPALSPAGFFSRYAIHEYKSIFDQSCKRAREKSGIQVTRNLSTRLACSPLYEKSPLSHSCLLTTLYVRFSLFNCIVLLSVVSFFDPHAQQQNNHATEIEESATLKTGNVPTEIKSVTLPTSRRSTRLPAAPPTACPLPASKTSH